MPQEFVGIQHVMHTSEPGLLDVYLFVQACMLQEPSYRLAQAKANAQTSEGHREPHDVGQQKCRALLGSSIVEVEPPDLTSAPIHPPFKDVLQREVQKSNGKLLFLTCDGYDSCEKDLFYVNLPFKLSS